MSWIQTNLDMGQLVYLATLTRIEQREKMEWSIRDNTSELSV